MATSSPDEQKLEFGKRVLRARLNAELGPVELARILEVTHQSVRQWEKGEAGIKLENLVPLANALGVTTDYLLGNEEDVDLQALLALGDWTWRGATPTPWLRRIAASIVDALFMSANSEKSFREEGGNSPSEKHNRHGHSAPPLDQTPDLPQQGGELIDGDLGPISQPDLEADHDPSVPGKHSRPGHRPRAARPDGSPPRPRLRRVPESPPTEEGTN